MVNFFHPLVFMGWPCSAGSPLCSSVCQKCSSRLVGNKSLKECSLAKLEKSRCGRNTAAFSLSFCKDLGLRHLTVTSIGSGTKTPLTNFAVISLCTLPGCCPWKPALAISQISSWLHPSKVAHSASHLIVVAANLPCAHKLSKAVANLLTGPFSKVLAGCSLSCSSCTPLSLFIPFPKVRLILLSKAKNPFSKAVSLGVKLGPLWQGCEEGSLEAKWLQKKHKLQGG